MNHNFPSVVCPQKVPSMAKRFPIDQIFLEREKDCSAEAFTIEQVLSALTDALTYWFENLTVASHPWQRQHSPAQ
jgi:hypothetical protein